MNNPAKSSHDDEKLAIKERHEAELEKLRKKFRKEQEYFDQKYSGVMLLLFLSTFYSK